LEHRNKGNLTTRFEQDLPFLVRPIRCKAGRERLARLILNSALLFLAITSIAPSVSAQLKRAKVELRFSQPDLVQITVTPPQPLQNWTFQNSYGSALGLGDRVLSVRDRDNGSVSIKRVAAGVFKADRVVATAVYDVKVSPGRASDLAHVSWVTKDGGILMPGDLLPIEVTQQGALDITFQLPSGWEVQPMMSLSAPSTYLIEDPTNAILTIGPSLKSSYKTVKGTRLDVVVSGDWNFSTEHAAESAKEIFKEYLELIRYKPATRSIVIIAPMPSLKGAETWQAETRGSTLLLLIDRNAGYKNWIGQLEVIFTHELLHLWVPNALKLKGDYDWFFEGFTLYQALLTAVRMKAITFEEYLNTLSRVYDSYRSQTDNLSLIEASEQRWTGASSAVYDKGMLVAFLYDLETRHATNGKSGLPDRYAELFANYAGKTVNANEAIMALLATSPEAENLLKSYVGNRQKLELAQALKRFGFIVQSDGITTNLSIVSNPSQDQVRLLKSLGYRR
jgi:hypothetical protein